MLVPVQGGVANLQKRIRSIHREQAMLATVPIPKLYIFNVSQKEFRNRAAAGTNWTIPACKPGQKYSKALEIPMLSLCEFDPATGANQMGTLQVFGETRELDGEVQPGLANDIIGTNSTSPALSLYTTNLEWFGVFSSPSPLPTEEELALANQKLREYMDLVYATGAELVQAGKKVAMIDRPRYNEAALILGRKPLWGSLEHTRGNCPECKNDIIEGATYCQHCHQAIDSASVAARAKKRQRDAEKMLAEESKP